MYIHTYVFVFLYIYIHLVTCVYAYTSPSLARLAIGNDYTLQVHLFDI